MLVEKGKLYVVGSRVVSNIQIPYFGVINLSNGVLTTLVQLNNTATLRSGLFSTVLRFNGGVIAGGFEIAPGPGGTIARVWAELFTVSPVTASVTNRSALLPSNWAVFDIAPWARGVALTAGPINSNGSVPPPHLELLRQTSVALHSEDRWAGGNFSLYPDTATSGEGSVFFEAGTDRTSGSTEIVTLLGI